MVGNNFCCRIFGLQQSYEICKTLSWKMESVFIYLFLPLAGLTLIWKRHEIFSKLWTNVGQYYLPVTFQTFGKRKLLLNWAKRRLPPHWSSHMETLSGGIADFWNDGSLLCTLVNTAVPGACPNPYRHWQKTPEHAQEVAYKYLGIIPIFSEPDFTSSLNPYLEKKLLDYLTLIRKSISQLEKDKLYYNFISTRYVVRGMGLYTAEQFRESEFYIYSKIKNPTFYNVEILILGPYSTYSKTTVLECLLKDSQKSVDDTKASNSWLKAKESYLDKLHNLNDSTEKSITIKVAIEFNRVKVCYTSRNFGVHEITISCDKEILMGSPFYVNIPKSSNDSFKRTDNKVKEINNDLENTFKTLNNKNEFSGNSDKLNKEIHQINKDEIMKNNILEEDVSTENKNNKDIDKIQNNIKEMRIFKNATESIGNIHTKMNPYGDLSGDNNLNSTNENTLEISKYLDNLRNKTKPEIKLNNVQEDDHPIYFSKENYSCFQRAVDCSFRRSCRITRKLPGLVQRNCALISGASPVCSRHTVLEDLGKLPAEEKRKKFSTQRSLAIQRDSKLASSPFSVKENYKEAHGNNEVENNIAEEDGTKEKTDSTRRNKNVFKKFVNIDNINKNDQDSRIYRVVKEKKLFWETVFQNSNYIKSNRNIKLIPNYNKDLPQEKFSEKISTIQNQIDRKYRKSDKLYSFSCLRYADPLRSLESRTLSRSYSDLRYIERKRSFKSYKSMDENLDQCCEISLDNRTRIYLDHISSFESNSIKGVLPVKSKVDKRNEDLGYLRTTTNTD